MVAIMARGIAFRRFVFESPRGAMHRRRGRSGAGGRQGGRCGGPQHAPAAVRDVMTLRKTWVCMVPGCLYSNKKKVFKRHYRRSYPRLNWDLRCDTCFNRCPDRVRLEDHITAGHIGRVPMCMVRAVFAANTLCQMALTEEERGFLIHAGIFPLTP